MVKWIKEELVHVKSYILASEYSLRVVYQISVRQTLTNHKILTALL